MDECLLCGAAGTLSPLIADAPDRLLRTPSRTSVHRCRACGGGVSLPRVAPEDLGAFYPSSYAPYVPAGGVLAVASALIQRALAARAQRGAPLNALVGRTPARALEVGAGRGDLAALLVRQGWSVTAVEPSAQACDVLVARGIEARCGTLEDIELEPEGYEVALFNHALEHTVDPAADLARVAAALRPGGLVLISVPHFGSWQRRRFGSRWFHLDLPRHRAHFSRRALAAVLERAGFDVVHLSTSTSQVGLPATLQYAAAGRCLFPGGIKLQVAALAAAGVWPIARALDALAGDGDVLHAVARRRDG